MKARIAILATDGVATAEASMQIEITWVALDKKDILRMGRFKPKRLTRMMVDFDGIKGPGDLFHGEYLLNAIQQVVG